MKNNIDKQLDIAESLIAEYPDSAISILLQIDTTKLTEHQKNLKSLFILYGCVIHASPIQLDSTDLEQGNIAFQGSFSKNEIKWLIVKSYDALQKGDPVGRIEYLKDAEFLATQLESEFDLAMIYQYLANVYMHGFNATVSRYYADKSIAILRQLNFPKQLREARMAVIRTLASTQDYQTMLDSMLAMKDEVVANAPDGYKTFFLDQLARAYDENGQSQKGIDIWHSIYDNQEISSNTLAHWANAYWRINEPDSAYILIRKAIALPHNNSDEYLCRNVEYRILEKMGRKAELARIDSLRNLAGNNVFEEGKLEESSLAINKKYDSATRQAWLETSRAHTGTLIAIFVGIIIAIIAVTAYLYLRKKNKLLKVEHENDILKIRILQDNLFESDNRQKSMCLKISGLFQSRFKLIDSLAVSYFECKETGQAQKRIYAEVKNSISNFSSPSATQELEDIVNSYNDNLMMKFREDYPNLSQAQYRLALYLFCRFSLSSISIFTDSDLRNIYVYKSRLKKTIDKADNIRKDLYLSYFG